jgi:single-strand DNA-binding protein
MNKTILIGRLAAEPELRFAPGTGNAVCSIRLAVDRRFQSKDGPKEADFIPVVIWGKPAEMVANHSAKGKLLGVAGRIQTRSYDAKDGTKRYVTEVVAEEVKILEWANGGQADSQSSGSFGEFEDMTPVEGEIPW